MDVLKVFGQLDNERGRRNEERALDAVTTANLSWIRSARLATREEDARGIDLVLETDVGGLFFQIKSSHRGKRKFIDTHGKSRTRIAVIVLQHLLTEKLFQTRILEAVHSERKAILDLRGC